MDEGRLVVHFFNNRQAGVRHQLNHPLYHGVVDIIVAFDFNGYPYILTLTNIYVRSALRLIRNESNDHFGIHDYGEREHDDDDNDNNAVDEDEDEDVTTSTNPIVVPPLIPISGHLNISPVTNPFGWVQSQNQRAPSIVALNNSLIDRPPPPNDCAIPEYRNAIGNMLSTSCSKISPSPNSNLERAIPWKSTTRSISP